MRSFLIVVVQEQAQTISHLNISNSLDIYIRILSLWIKMDRATIRKSVWQVNHVWTIRYMKCWKINRNDILSLSSFRTTYYFTIFCYNSNPAVNYNSNYTFLKLLFNAFNLNEKESFFHLKRWIFPLQLWWSYKRKTQLSDYLSAFMW